MRRRLARLNAWARYRARAWLGVGELAGHAFATRELTDGLRRDLDAVAGALADARVQLSGNDQRLARAVQALARGLEDVDGRLTYYERTVAALTLAKKALDRRRQQLARRAAVASDGAAVADPAPPVADIQLVTGALADEVLRVQREGAVEGVIDG